MLASESVVSLLNNFLLSASTFLSLSANNVSNYWILSTDYDNFAIVYFCTNIEDNKSREFAWVLSRQPQIASSVKLAVDILITAHFDRTAMYEAEQSDTSCEPRDP